MIDNYNNQLKPTLQHRELLYIDRYPLFNLLYKSMFEQPHYISYNNLVQMKEVIEIDHPDGWIIQAFSVNKYDIW